MLLKMASNLMFIIILNITISGSITAFAQQSKDERQQTEINQIYGVRWFLGDYFAFHMKESPPPNQEMFILMFNSVEELDDQVYLKISGTRYGCYERFLQIQSAGEHHYEYNKNATKQGQNFTNAMYKCIVYGQDFNNLQEVSYQIISGWTIFQGKDNSTQIKKYREYVLFQSKLRIPQNMDSLNFFFLADWGLISEEVEKQKGYKDIMPSLKKTLSDNKNISMLVFGGDLAYDFEGQMYIDILKYLQPLTSQIVTIATPGNHESVYHEDSLQLFVESFYSPMWYQYFNYFSVTLIQAHNLVIVSYDPENYVFPWINRLGKNLTEVFELQLNKTITSYIKKNYDVVAFSHYPMHCSERGEHYQTCEQNQVRFDPFMKKFTQMGIDLYLSGHLHIYERTKPMCSETNFTFNEQNIYNKQCPIFVVDGSAGNSMWVEMQKRYEPQDFSGKIVYGTGYGLVTFDHRNITYQHHLVHNKENATLADRIILYEPKSSGDNKNNKQESDKIEKAQQKIIIGLEITALVVVAGIACCLIYQFRIKNSKPSNNDKKTSHVEMVEENFQTPAHNSKNQAIDQPSIQ